MRGLLLASLFIVSLEASASATVRAGVVAWQDGDPGKATAIWRPLAENGDADAAFNLGQAYRLGRGVPADSSAARRWFERAAKAGHLDAQVSLGLLLFDVGDRSAALMWLGRAADRGDPRALLVTGTALFNGDGMKSDPVRGYAYVSRAAAQGLAPAKTTLADMDKVIPRAQRQQGVALAMKLAGGSPAAKAAGKASTPKIARATVPPKAPAARAATPPPPKIRVANAVTSAPLSTGGSGGWRIQLGAFGSRGAAQALYARLGPRLNGAQAYYIPVGAMTRLQVGPFAKAEATATCVRLAPQPCFVVAAK
ncbi:MAG: SPOR domain-containing protein [Pseudomonadota bacterium]